MEALKILEDKVIGLVESIQNLRDDNKKLAQERDDLQIKVEDLERALQADVQKSSELHKEKENASLLLDDLIKSIDSLVEGEAR